MKILKGYSVEQIGGLYFVVFALPEEKMVMSKPYRTEAGANKAFDKITFQAGVIK